MMRPVQKMTYAELVPFVLDEAKVSQDFAERVAAKIDDMNRTTNQMGVRRMDEWIWFAAQWLSAVGLALMLAALLAIPKE
jgi:hypothetical protein